MSRSRKVHRRDHASAHGYSKHDHAACGNNGEWKDCIIVTEKQFVWFPRERQCGACVSRIPAWPCSATPEMLITVETIILAIARIGSDIADPGYVHRCFHRFHDEYVTCSCGARSVLFKADLRTKVQEHGDTWLRAAGYGNLAPLNKLAEPLIKQCPMIAFVGGYNACTLNDGHACAHETISGTRHVRWGTKDEAREYFAAQYRAPAQLGLAP